MSSRGTICLLLVTRDVATRANVATADTKLHSEKTNFASREKQFRVVFHTHLVLKLVHPLDSDSCSAEQT